MRNMFDTLEMCDKHFNETTFGAVSTTPDVKQDSETVVDVNVDDVDTSTETINEPINENNMNNGGNEDEC